MIRIKDEELALLIALVQQTIDMSVCMDKLCGGVIHISYIHEKLRDLRTLIYPVCYAILAEQRLREKMDWEKLEKENT